MINFVPSSIAWPSKKLLPCKKKRSHKCMFYEPEKARINHGCDNSVCLCLALDRNADGPIGVAPVKQPEHQDARDSNLHKDLFLWDDDSGFIIKYPLYKESQHNVSRLLVPQYPQGKREDDDIQTDTRVINWSLEVVERYINKAIEIAETQR